MGRSIFEYGKENFVHEICYRQLAVSQKETGLYFLTFSSTSFKIEYKPFKLGNRQQQINNILKQLTWIILALGKE